MPRSALPRWTLAGRDAQVAGTRVRTGPLVALSIGVLVFSLVVWLAFWLGFERMRPDLGLDSSVALAEAPQLRLVEGQEEWELLDPGEPERGRGPQYTNTGAESSQVCVLTWQVGSVSESAVDLTGARTDQAATRAVLAAAGMPSESGDRVTVLTDDGETLELLHLPQDRADGLIASAASRAFSGSHHYMLVSLICEQGGDVSAQRMHDVLADVVVDLRVEG